MTLETIILINGPLCMFVGFLLGFTLFSKRVLGLPIWHRTPLGVFIAVMIMRGTEYCIKSGVVPNSAVPSNFDTIWITPFSDFLLALAFAWLLLSYMAVSYITKRTTHGTPLKSN